MRPSTRLPGRSAKRTSPPLPPQEVERLLRVAGAHFEAGRLDAAAEALAAIEARNPGDVRAPYSLANIDIRRGGLKPALERLRTAVRLDPALFLAQHNLGYVAQSLGLWPEAADAFARALALRPDAAETGFSLAIAQAVLGRTDEAIQGYRRLAADPTHRLRALTRLAILSAAAVTEPELETLRTAAADPSVPLDARTALLFALGEALEARRRDDEAFAAFAAGNRLKHEALARTPANPRAVAQDHARASAFIEGLFTAEFIARNRATAADAPAPIFIVGMPRSGSTLIEQILASHPAVQAMGETGVLPALLERAYAEADGGRLGRSEFRKAGETYLRDMRALGWKMRSRLVDKTLENYLHVGAIAVMFPRAVILHSVRDPVDTCLACYRQLFVSGGETLYDLAQIGAEYVGYRRMMDHWRTVTPGRVVDVSLEALIADPEAQIRRLLEACGLSWDPACLSFHETERAVGSASAAQVRRPLYATSQQRWRRYERHLGPLLQALGPYAPPISATAGR